MQPIRVLAFDDNKDFREMLRMLVDTQPDMTCVGVHADLSELMRHVEATVPDVVLMDIQMPGMDGIAGVQRIKAERARPRILMQTVFEDEDKVFDAIRAGADGYLLKTARAEEIAQAIRDVHAGGSAMTPTIAYKVLELFRANAPLPEAREASRLSDREKSVLTLLVKGRSYKMIAAELGISYHTVDSHIRSIYEKLHVNSGTEAVSKAIKDRLV
ncbi:MAG TPA: response regulator transcription factor [Flavobacteriales bacterium]|jgi:DNA-binding NarL/FixJ family response regulator|nr:response regulator transcription factor [Flavobacteriales bacterium]